MDIKEFLSSNDAIIDVVAPDKVRLLRDLSKRAAAALRMDAAKIASELLKREELGSTGVGGGIAIPHARIRDLKKPFGVVARLKEAVDFDAIDSKPVDIVFLLLLPATAEGQQLNALACVTRALRKADVVEKLRGAGDSTNFYRVITQS
jgi:PTS system nitrogen regulatory IIA component